MAQQAPRRSLQGLQHRYQSHFGQVTAGNNLSNAALNALLARLQWQYCVLEEELEGAPCVCAERPETPEVPDVRIAPDLITLPEELRDMIWWQALAPSNGIVRIVPYNITDPQDGRDRRIGGPNYHPLRFEVPGAARERYNRERMTWMREGEGFSERHNQFNLLRVNPQIYREADSEFWRMAALRGLMFSFGPEFVEVRDPGPTGSSEYDGILSAWTFFNTLLRDDPAVDPNLPERRRYLQYMPGVDYLPLIRNAHGIGTPVARLLRLAARYDSDTGE
ncbi:hypothetical protein KVR01_000398 [Diaporthe batatas]|uniref:uncharacterized protein n=1 Tax=Diaporthe batatas TaxID=748121 RepID=UPI001D038B97|nr:uncharacterized protein KVR01_000398 [Diaporthe batatas]KAG8169653.1 hypothetical protein KVR01_000398 [Diaporthe batatas]